MNFFFLLFLLCISVVFASEADISAEGGVAPQDIVLKLKLDIQETIQKTREAMLAHPSSNKVIILGNTGDGKSALLRYLSGSELRVISKGGRLCIDDDSGQIIHTTTSGTRYPFASLASDGNMFWDCPGFFDTRPSQRILNALSIHQLFTGSFKIALVVPEPYLEQPRLVSLRNLVEHITEIFPVDQVYNGLSLVLTKSRAGEIDPLEVFQSFLAEEGATLDPRTRRVIQHFLTIGGEGAIAYFPRATPPVPGFYPNDYVGPILERIQNNAVGFFNDVVAKPVLDAESILLTTNLGKRFIDDIYNFILDNVHGDTVRKCTDLVESNLDPRNIGPLVASLQGIFGSLQPLQETLSADDLVAFAHELDHFSDPGSPHSMTQVMECLLFLRTIKGDILSPTAIGSWSGALQKTTSKVQSFIFNPVNLYKEAALGTRSAKNSLAVIYRYGLAGTPRDYSRAVSLFNQAGHDGYIPSLINLGIMYLNGEGTKSDGDAFRCFESAGQLGHVNSQYNLGIMLEQAIGCLKDDVQAVVWYQRAAKQKYAPAQNNLGVMYELGLGIGKDDAEAAKWYGFAAEQGYPPAQYNLGRLFQYGMGIGRNDTEAVRLYGLAATEGCLPAQNNLGVMFELGAGGLPKDDVEATRLYASAAAFGYDAARNNFGVMLQSGAAGEKDDSRAAAYFQLAADQGNAVAEYNLGVMCEFGGVGFSKDEPRAFNLYKRAVERSEGPVEARVRLGVMHLNGIGTDKNEPQAFACFQSAAGHPVAEYNLGVMYESGLGGASRDHATAFSLYNQAAGRAECPVEAHVRLGVMHLNGIGTDKNDAEALKYFHLAAAGQGHPSIQYILGSMYETVSIFKNESEAFEWYRRAATTGHVDAKYRLSVMFLNGTGVGKDDSQAFYWCQLAASQGHVAAQYNLGVMFLKSIGTPKNDAEALRWFETASAANHVEAQAAFAAMTFLSGKEPAASAWFRRAAAGGHARANEVLPSLRH